MKPLDDRLKIIIIFSASLLLGVPVWWHLTQVYRAALPHTRMTQGSSLDTWTLQLDLHVLGRDQREVDSSAQLFRDHTEYFEVILIVECILYLDVEMNIEL